MVNLAEVDYAYVFATDYEAELIRYKQQYGQKYTTLYLDVKANNYILNDGI